MIAPSNGNGKNEHHITVSQRENGEGVDVTIPWQLVSKPKQRQFLVEYLKSGSVPDASEACGWSRGAANHYLWLIRDPKYKKAFEQARGLTASILKDALLHRAIYGWDEPVYGSLGGNAGTGLVGEKRKFDNKLGVDMLDRLEGRSSGGGTTFYVQNNGGEVKIIEDANWYGNADRLPPEAS